MSGLSALINRSTQEIYRVHEFVSSQIWLHRFAGRLFGPGLPARLADRGRGLRRHTGRQRRSAGLLISSLFPGLPEESV